MAEHSAAGTLQAAPVETPSLGVPGTAWSRRRQARRKGSHCHRTGPRGRRSLRCPSREAATCPGHPTGGGPGEDGRTAPQAEAPIRSPCCTAPCAARRLADL